MYFWPSRPASAPPPGRAKRKKALGVLALNRTRLLSGTTRLLSLNVPENPSIHTFATCEGEYSSVRGCDICVLTTPTVTLAPAPYIVSRSRGNGSHSRNRHPFNAVAIARTALVSVEELYTRSRVH